MRNVTRKVTIVFAALVAFALAGTLAFGQRQAAGECGGKCSSSAQRHDGKAQTAQASEHPSRISYLRLYCTTDGNSHFQSVAGELRKTNFAPPASPLYIGDSTSTSTAFFGGFDAGWGADDLKRRLYHPTPAVQFFVILEGEFSITVTDGETRRFGPGGVVRLEDTAPCKGHITVVGDTPGFTMFVR